MWSAAGSAQTVVFEETFDKCNAKGGNDGNFSAGATNTSMAKSAYDNDGWSASGSFFMANKSIRLATGSAQGHITSPTIKVNSENKITLVVDAGACTGKTPSMKVSVSNATITPNSATLAAGKFQEYSFSLSDITGDIQITITILSGQQSYINNVKVIEEPSTTIKTKTSFGAEIDNSTITLANGKLGGDIFKGYTASETTGVPGTIKYESDATDIASVNEKGEVTINNYGTATITATFTPDDTEKYAGSKTIYTIVNKNPDIENLPVVFDYKVTHGSLSVSNKEDKMSNSIVTISSSKAAFKCTDTNTKEPIDYRIYGSSTTTISTTIGNIVKVEFEGDNSNYKLTNFKPFTGFNITDKKATWTGKSQSVDFETLSKQVRIKKITVTVEVPIAKDLTLDEDQDYHNAAYDNYTVTLKRNLVKDEWNTFCVPFDITEEEAKEVFGDDVKICAFQNATATTVNFASVTSIKNSKPYLIKPSIDTPADGYKFTLKPINSSAVEIDGTAGNVQMIGTFSPVDITTFAKGNTFAAGLGEDNTILKATSGAKMRGYRAFFIVPASLEGQTLKANISGIITAIDAIHGVAKADAPVYNLNGQRVTGELKAGIYVKNGKKFIVK